MRWRASFWCLGVSLVACSGTGPPTDGPAERAGDSSGAAGKTGDAPADEAAAGGAGGSLDDGGEAPGLEDATDDVQGGPADGGPVDAADASMDQASEGRGDAPGDATDAAAWVPGSFPDFASGSRLRARTYGTDDGQKIWHGWLDTVTNQDCSFTTTTTGEVRCLPFWLITNAYADAFCKTPVTRAGMASPTYGRIERPCDVRAFKQRAGGQMAVPTLYALMGNSCVSMGGGGQGYVYDELPGTTFVAAKEVRDPRGALAARYLQSEDGALQPMGAYDPTSQHRCAPLADGAPDRCVPQPVSYIPDDSFLFSTSACSAPYYRFYPGSPLCSQAWFQLEPPAVVRLDEFYKDLCPRDGTASFYQPGTGTPLGGVPDAVWSRRGGSCQPTTSPGIQPQTYWMHGGARVELTEMPAVKLIDDGAGRIRRRTLATPTNERIFASTFFDTTVGLTCTPAQASGALRCVPDVPSSLILFTDAACKLPQLAVYTDHAATCQTPWPEPPLFVGVGANSGGSSAPRVFKRAASQAPAARPAYAVRTSDGSCEDVTKDVPASQYALYDLTEVTADLAVLTDAVE